MGEPTWPEEMLWWNEDTGQDSQFLVAPVLIAKTLADALGAALEGDLAPADEALALYEREVHCA